MYAGVAAAVLVASRLPSLQRTFEDSQTYAVLVAGDLYETAAPGPASRGPKAGSRYGFFWP